VRSTAQQGREAAGPHCHGSCLRTPRASAARSLRLALGRREADSEGKTLKQGSGRRWLLSSPALAPAAPGGWVINSRRHGVSPVRFPRSHSVPQTVGMQHSRPSSCATVRSAGADIPLGCLQSWRSQLTLGGVRGGTRRLLRRAGLLDDGCRWSPWSTKRAGQHR
jgi:hypothetical protein